MSAWCCLSIYMQKNLERGTECGTKAALNLAREHYGDSKLKQRMRDLQILSIFLVLQSITT